MYLEKDITKEDLKNMIKENIKTLSRKTIETASTKEIYKAVAFTIKDIIADKWIDTHANYEKNDVKVVYYLSMEFLMGRFLGNSIINLSLNKIVTEALSELEVDYNLVEDSENDPGLGNGGLGRLAACFLDSLSTLGYPAYGCGIRYHFGIFEQKIENGYQVEKYDDWLNGGDVWGVKREEYSQEVKFGGYIRTTENKDGSISFVHEDYTSVIAVPYDYPVVGYGNDVVNSLRLWDATAKNIFDLQSFNKGNYGKAVEEQNLARTLSEVLYPADDLISGKELRLKQQYFFISATLQRIIARFKEKHTDLRTLPDYVQLQLNDTHPSVAVAELMRLLMDECGLGWDVAWEITNKTCAYTNHTILSEALEKWPIDLFQRLLPRIYMVVEEINRRFCATLVEKYGENSEKLASMAILWDNQVKMAHLAIVSCHSVNGVAYIHTEILKNQELKDFYEIFPEKFNNKTNGITQRRWLAHCNKKLSNLINDSIGNKWITDLSDLTKLEKLSTDKKFQNAFMAIKKENKIEFAKYIKESMGVTIDPNSIYDVQVKRLHEYKRQLMNILQVIGMYITLKENPDYDMAPRTFIFSAKAAASYHRAKLIIKLINSVGDVVNNDITIKGKIKVLFVPNYRVSLAEKLIPASDVSEQISTAGKEASGTGNMKFMLNGAVTIGTLDGANVEMLEEVGEDNILIFGLKVDEIKELLQNNSYNPKEIMDNNPMIKKIMTTLVDGTFATGNSEMFRDLYDSILYGVNGNRPDEYFILKDLADYALTQTKVDKLYKNQSEWARVAIMNVAKSGKFSSDRTIEQYANEIWKLKKVTLK